MTHAANLHDGTGILVNEPNVGIREFIAGPGRVYAMVPSDGAAGFCEGCICFNENSPSGTAIYFNEGSNTSCKFRLEETAVATAQVFDLPVFEMRTPAGAVLTTASASTMGATYGTFGSASPMMVSEAYNNNHKTDNARFALKLPPTYSPGGAITIVVSAKANTTLPAVTGTVGVSAYKTDRNGGIGSNLVATAVQNITTSWADYSFTVTPTGLNPGDELDCEITLDLDDTGGSANKTANATVRALVDLLG